MNRLLQFFRDEQCQKYKSENIINLNGSTVLPGLIDAHCHFYGLGLNQSVIDLTGTKSFSEIIDKISNDDKKSVIRGRGWDQNDWTIKKFPDKLTIRYCLISYECIKIVYS